MKNICLYFQIHHPVHLRTFRFFEIGKSKSCYDDSRNEREIQEAVTNYYLPTNDFFLNLIGQTKGKLKLSYYISGTTFDQFLLYSPKILGSFCQLAETGQVEFIGGTDSHSIASLADNKDEFKRQIIRNKERIEYYFGQKPKVFANTDLLYSNKIGEIVAESGYQAIITNGARKILLSGSPNHIYSGIGFKKIKILLRNESISNEFSLLLNNPCHLRKPKQIEQLFTSLLTINPEEPVVNIYLNYRALGGYGLDVKQLFFEELISKIIRDQPLRFSLPSELTEQFDPESEIGSDEPVCWTELFHSSWYPGNELQKEAMKQLFKLEKQVGNSVSHKFKIDWQNLQTSDHFYLMDENHPDYQKYNYSQSIYKSRYDAFINYMNILADFRQRLTEDVWQKSRKVLHKSLSHTV